MSFTVELRERNEDLFTAFWQHPFLRGLHDGSLPRACVVHYVEQQEPYLTSYIRCYGLGIARSPDRGWMAWFSEQARSMLESEQQALSVLCNIADVDYEITRNEEPAPSCQAYVNHMELCARDTVGVLLAALLPCAWMYGWMGTRAMTEAPPSPDNPFHDWWAHYASERCQGYVDDFLWRVDQLAAEAGAAERERMARAFRQGCYHEVCFWNMAWSLEDWVPPAGRAPVNGLLLRHDQVPGERPAPPALSGTDPRSGRIASAHVPCPALQENE